VSSHGISALDAGCGYLKRALWHQEATTGPLVSLCCVNMNRELETGTSLIAKYRQYRQGSKVGE